LGSAAIVAAFLLAGCGKNCPPPERPLAGEALSDGTVREFSRFPFRGGGVGPGVDRLNNKLFHGGGDAYTVTYLRDLTPSISNDRNFVTHTIALTATLSGEEAVYQTAADALAAQTAAASVTVRIRQTSDATWTDGVAYTIAAYFWENQYAGMGLWVEKPEVFFDDGAGYGASDHVRPGFYGMYPSPPPTAGQAVYSGVAFGYYERNRITLPLRGGGDRFLIDGTVTLNADFAAGTILGDAELSAHNLDYSAAAGSVGIALDGMMSATAEGAAIFSGDASVSRAGSGVLDALSTSAPLLADFNGGFFGGNGAPEAAGYVNVDQIDGSSVESRLEFSFITRREPPEL
jgi:hypothetical protein